MHHTQVNTEAAATAIRTAQHVHNVGEALQIILVAGGRRIATHEWWASASKHHGTTLNVYSVNGRIVILSRTWERGEVTGWDVYAPLCESIRVDATLAALRNYITHGASNG